MSVEKLEGRWYITTSCPPHEDGKPCSTCWSHQCANHLNDEQEDEG